MAKMAYTYMMANKRNGTLYVGVTSNLERRVFQHKDKTYPGFTAKYGIDLLVWFEGGESIEEAIALEKKIKNWKRQQKTALIEKTNPQWRDLSEDF
ncbi:MAG: GIY-YIG nuclease family protein [Propionibacteriaceae bacterium]|nr:GIY-YIG nuclease family protein [Propionibacteriaceae bacterium]